MLLGGGLGRAVPFIPDDDQPGTLRRWGQQIRDDDIAPTQQRKVEIIALQQAECVWSLDLEIHAAGGQTRAILDEVRL